MNENVLKKRGGFSERYALKAFLWGAAIAAVFIIPCMIIHIVNNTLSFIELNGQSNVVTLLILACSMMLLVLGLWWFARKSNTKTATQVDVGQSCS